MVEVGLPFFCDTARATAHWTKGTVSEQMYGSSFDDPSLASVLLQPVDDTSAKIPFQSSQPTKNSMRPSPPSALEQLTLQQIKQVQQQLEQKPPRELQQERFVMGLDQSPWPQDALVGILKPDGPDPNTVPKHSFRPLVQQNFNHADLPDYLNKAGARNATYPVDAVATVALGNNGKTGLSLTSPNSKGRQSHTNGYERAISQATTTEDDGNLANPKADAVPRTTVVVRNIPAEYNQEMLLQEFNDWSVFDFLYLPFCWDTRKNHTYAFINFISEAHARQFQTHWHRRRLSRHGLYDKPLNIAFSELQGRAMSLRKLKSRHARTIKYKTLRFNPVIFDRGRTVYLVDALEDQEERGQRQADNNRKNQEASRRKDERGFEAAQPDVPSTILADNYNSNFTAGASADGFPDWDTLLQQGKVLGRMSC